MIFLQEQISGLLDATSRGRLEVIMRFIGKLLLRIILFVIGIPITILYFALSFFGSIITGIGYIAGVALFGLTLILWITGQFEVWYQIVVAFGISLGVFLIPMWFTESGGEALLLLKGQLDHLAQ